MKNEDLKPYEPKSFFKMAEEGRTVKGFIVLFDNKANQIVPPKGGQITPFIEDQGGTFQHWLVISDEKNQEVARQNTANTSYILWNEE